MKSHRCSQRNYSYSAYSSYPLDNYLEYIPATGIDGQSRTSDDAPDRPLNVRYEQIMTLHHRVAD